MPLLVCSDETEGPRYQAAPNSIEIAWTELDLTDHELWAWNEDDDEFLPVLLDTSMDEATFRYYPNTLATPSPSRYAYLHAKEGNHLESTEFIDWYNFYETIDPPMIDTNFDPGDPEVIWNSLTTNVTTSYERKTIRGWGSFGAQMLHARIDLLFDRDYVWAATQTMVSIGSLALWAIFHRDRHKL